MRVRLLVLFLTFACTLEAQVNPSSATVQQSVARDPQAIAVINSAVAATLGSSGVLDVHDYTASGTISSWAGRDVNAPVTLKGSGVSAFRIEASLPDGTVSWAVHDGIGTFVHADGSKKQIPNHNAVTLGVLTFPLAKLIAAASSSDVTVSYVGAITGPDGERSHQIRIHQNLVAPAKDHDGSVNRLMTADLLIDSNTYQLLAIRDHTHPVDAANIDIDHEVRFSDYRQVNGINVPFAISEYVVGQRTFAIQLSAVSFNAGLTAADFVF